MYSSYLQISFRPSIDECRIPDFHKRSVYVSWPHDKDGICGIATVFAEGFATKAVAYSDTQHKARNFDEALRHFSDSCMYLMLTYAVSYGEERYSEIKGDLILTIGNRSPCKEHPDKLESQEYDIVFPKLTPERILKETMDLAKAMYKAPKVQEKALPPPPARDLQEAPVYRAAPVTRKGAKKSQASPEAPPEGPLSGSAAGAKRLPKTKVTPPKVAAN